MSLEEFQRIRTRLKNKLEVTDWQLDGVLKNRELANSHDMVELQVERLKLLDKLKYLRPANSRDIAYRENILENFSYWADEHIPDSLHLIFHGSTLANSERILNSGKITSGKDRWTIRTSGDEKGEISVSTKASLFISLTGHMDLVAQDYYLPAGCLFVLQTDTPTYRMAKNDCRIPNVYLRKNPEQLYAVITTPENKDRVKWWMQKNNFDPKKVYDFNSFKEKIEEDQIFFSLINCTSQKYQK